VGGEFGSIDKDVQADQASLVLAFPDVYEVGMSHLGTQILYHGLSREPDIRVERCFAPWPDLEAELRSRGMPLVSLETFSPLAEFDVIGVSLQHELCFTNFLNILDLTGVPLRSEARDDSHPFVLAGGPGASHPEPVAPFFDAFYLGDAEGRVADLVRLVSRMRRERAPRLEILRAAAATPGVYCPGLYRTVRDPFTGFEIPVPADPGAPEKVARVILEDLDSHPLPPRVTVPWNRAVFDRVSVEIARGCSEGCRFCEAGFTYRPLRDRSPDRILCDTLATVRDGGHDEVSLGALSPADYPALAPLVHALSTSLTPEGVTLSVSSLRAYGLSDSVLRDLRAVRAAGLTLAPEAGSQRLRDVINKNICHDDLMEAARRAFDHRWQRLKLYFMIGLPTETDDDVTAIVSLAREVLRLGRGMGRAQVTASVGVFVPRPHTPFQWEGMASPEVLATRQSILRDLARKSGVTVKLADARDARLEAVMARGDRRLADVVEAAFRKGCRFDNWGEFVRHDLWDEAMVEAGVDPGDYLRPLPLDGRLPWEVADVPVSRDFLLRERARAYEARTTAPCEKPPAPDGERPDLADLQTVRTVSCHACGAGCNPVDLARVRGAIVERGRLMETHEPEADRETGIEGEAREPEVDGVAWHLVFTKVGRSAWLSQKDLVKHLPRILRRAGLRVKLSGGFHPLPKVSYREPMPVGYQGAGEWMDAVVLEGAPSLEDLNRASVAGMVFREARILEGKRTPVEDSRYVFAADPGAGDPVALLDPVRVVALGEQDLAALAQAPLDPDPRLAGNALWILVWPREDHPPGRPHEYLTAALGREYVPGDLVRL
jgi:radical SAM family uncharacterized protein